MVVGMGPGISPLALNMLINTFSKTGSIALTLSLSPLCVLTAIFKVNLG